jgi:hypothetical protein
MDALHTVIQIAMGWPDSHLHSFTKDGNCWTVPNPSPYTVSLDLDEARFRLHEVLTRVNDSLIYIYDFDADLRHRVRLEAFLDNSATPTCIAGSGNCPIDDDGYSTFTVHAAAAALQHEPYPAGSLA